MDSERLRRFIALYERKRELEAEAKEVGERLRELEWQLLQEFASEGVTQVRVDGVTVYVRRELYATPLNEEALCDALAELGYGDLVRRTVHRQQLSAWVREREDDLPEPVARWLNISERYQLRVRR